MSNSFFSIFPSISSLKLTLFCGFKLSAQLETLHILWENSLSVLTVSALFKSLGFLQESLGFSEGELRNLVDCLLKILSAEMIWKVATRLLLWKLETFTANALLCSLLLIYQNGWVYWWLSSGSPSKASVDEDVYLEGFRCLRLVLNIEQSIYQVFGNQLLYLAGL